MASQQIAVTDALYAYMLSVSPPEPDVLRDLRAETAGMKFDFWQITPLQGHVLTMLVELIGARRVLEVGVYTGYSSISMARALPPAPQGKLIALDISEEFTSMARRYWKRAGVDDRIELRLAPAVESMDVMLRAGEGESFDLIFVDADKPNYVNYYERGLQLLRPGGLLLVDNTLFSGRVLDPDDPNLEPWRREWTRGVMEFNQTIRDDKRITLAMTPIGDGLTFCRKR
jgi:predicted O-methyltransferase YrrM